LNNNSSGKKVAFTQQQTKRVNHFIKPKLPKAAPIENPFTIFFKHGLPSQYPRDKAEICARMIRQQYSRSSLEAIEVIREELIAKKNRKVKNEQAKLCTMCMSGSDTRYATYDEPIPPVKSSQMDVEHIPVVEGQERPHDAQ